MLCLTPLTQEGLPSENECLGVGLHQLKLVSTYFIFLGEKMCVLRGEAELWYVVFKKNKTKLFFFLVPRSQVV